MTAFDSFYNAEDLLCKWLVISWRWLSNDNARGRLYQNSESSESFVDSVVGNAQLDMIPSITVNTTLVRIRTGYM